MFLMDTAMFFIDVNDAVKEVSYTLTSNFGLSLSDRYSLTGNLPFPTESVLYAFMASTSCRTPSILTRLTSSF